MECIALGTGGMMPMPLRLTTSVMVRRNGKMLIFDAGEGIQIAIKKGKLGIGSLDAVAVTHLHADHVLGLPGLLMFRAQNDDPEPLTVIGPPGIKRFIRHTLEDLRYHVNFRIDFVEWSERAGRQAWSWNGAQICWEPLEHSAFCLGYRLEEPLRPGKFHPEKAAALNVPEGPMFGRLQAGEAVELGDGKIVQPSDVLGPARRGRIVAFVTDTSPCPAIGRLIAGADLAFVEGMFSNVHKTEAYEKKHMTAEQTANAAAAAGVGKLVLVHISPRYTRDDEAMLEAEARTQFKNAEVARPLMAYPVPLVD